MAVIRRCFCCDVRTGTLLVAVWTIFLAVASVIQTARIWGTSSVAYAPAATYLAVWAVMAVLSASLGITALFLIIGIIKDRKALLVPFLIIQGLIIIVYVTLMVVTIVLLINGYIINFNYLGVVLSVDSLNDWIELCRIVYGCVAGGIAIGTIFEIVCFLCVLSQYQELRDGRGRGLPQTTTIVTTIQQPQGYVNAGAVPLANLPSSDPEQPSSSGSTD